MATIAITRLVNIISVTQGANTYCGVRSISIATNGGVYAPLLKEGHLYPSGAENLGLSQFPVTTSMVYEQSDENMLALLNEPTASLVILKKKDGGAGNATITISNHKFNPMSQPQALQAIAQPTIQGFAFSSDGATLPIAVT